MSESDEFREAEANYLKAKEQVELYSKVAHTSAWASDQLAIWREVMAANAWVEPGGSAPSSHRDGGR